MQGLALIGYTCVRHRSTFRPINDNAHCEIGLCIGRSCRLRRGSRELLARGPEEDVKCQRRGRDRSNAWRLDGRHESSTLKRGIEAKIEALREVDSKG